LADREQAPYVTHEEHHRALVERLATGIAPVRRLWPISVRLTLWLVVEAAVLLWVLAHTGNNFMLKLGWPTYVLEIVFFALAAALSAQLALRSAIPGRRVRPAEAEFSILLVLAGTTVLILARPIDTSGSMGEFVRTGIRCMRDTCALAALPWLALWWAVKRGVPLRGGISGVYVGAGALFFSFALMRIACPIDEPLHVITFHLLPALAVIALSALAGRTWLGFRLRLLRSDRAP
jgi:hypothetical protein